MKNQWMKSLCFVMSVTTYLSATVYENAENGNVDKWQVYDNTPAGATIMNVVDEEKGNVIEFLGDGSENGYRIGNFHGRANAWNNSSEKILNWSMKYDESFTIFVSLNTIKGHRYLIYAPTDYSGDWGYGLGTEAIDGTWRSYSRDLKADLKGIDAENSILSVDGLFIRGSGFVDDIALVNSKGAKNPANWRVYDNSPEGASIEAVVDSEKGNVVQLIGEGEENGFAFGGKNGTDFAWNETSNRQLKWSMKYDESFTIFVSLNTTKGHRYLIYAPTDYSGDWGYGLGTEAIDGTWRSYSRNLEADLKGIDAENSILSVDGFLIRGSGLIDDIKLVNSKGAKNPANWRVYDNSPEGASIEAVVDNEKGNVVQLIGEGEENGFALGGKDGTDFAWKEITNRQLNWSMKYNESFTIFVSLNTIKGHRYLIYAPTDYSGDWGYGLGTEAIDGTWRSYSRNLEADLKGIDAENSILSVDGFFIRGSGLIDDIILDNKYNTSVNFGKSEAQFTAEADNGLKMIKKLVEDAMLKKKSNVVYITAGDSTRDSYHAAQYYWYKNRLAPFNITYHHESQSGIRAEDWASNKFKSSGGKCLDNAVEASTGEEGSTTILEYSLGINDSHKNNSTPEEWEEHIKFGITEFQRLKPKALILLVVPVTTYSEENNIALKNIYIKISKELHLPLLNQKRVLKNKFDNPDERVKYYYDNIHPNFFGAIRLIDYIIYNITSNESKKYIKWNPLHINNNHSTGNLAEGKSVKKSLWQTKTGMRIDSENYRSLDEISVIGNSLLKIKHEGNIHSTVIKDKNNQVIGRFDTGRLRFSDKLNDDEPYEYDYLYLPPEASSIGININVKFDDNAEYTETIHPIVEYIVNDLVDISRDDIYSELNITK